MIDRDQAVAIAHVRAGENGWGLAEPLAVTHRRGWFSGGQYEVRSDPTKRGSKVIFIIDDRTGLILREGYIPR